MGNFIFLIIIAIAIIAICRFLAAKFKVIRIIMSLVPWVVAIIYGINDGFWAGVITLFVSALLVGLFFGSKVFDWDEDPQDLPIIDNYPIRISDVISDPDEIVEHYKWISDYICKLLKQGNEDNRYFMKLSDDQKLSTYVYLDLLSGASNLYFKTSDGGYGPSNPNYYLGEIDEEKNKNGIGVLFFSWKMEYDNNYRYYLSKFFIGRFRHNSMDENNGIFITLSSDGKHDKIDKPKDFYVTRSEGVRTYDR